MQINPKISNAFKLFLLVLACGFYTACSKSSHSPKAVFTFQHQVNGEPLQLGTLIYTNAAGNNYQVDELQYFVSDICLITESGETVRLLENGLPHYVDISLLNTQKIEIDPLPKTHIRSVKLTFGVSEAKNMAGTFPDPPERDMFWPGMMGGGYHHMKMNGKWKDPNQVLNSFNLHLGKGKISGTEYAQNSFELTFPIETLQLKSNQTLDLTLTMHIEKWFEAPNQWDWNETGGAIMENQEAMAKAVENGKNAFELQVQSGIHE